MVKLAGAAPWPTRLSKCHHGTTLTPKVQTGMATTAWVPGEADL
jgi:hypothetical protein